MVSLTKTVYRVQSLPKRLGESKPVLITLIASLVGVYLIYVATHTPVAVGGIEPALMVLGLVLVVVAVRDWKFGIKALLVVVIVEGAVRKWFMPSATEMVYFYKDVLMIATLAGYFRKRGRTPFLIKRHLKLVSVILGVFTLYAVASMGLPGGPHPVIGLLGFKAYCLYIPLAFLTPRAFPSKEELLRFLKWYLLIVFPVAVIGMIQFLDTNPQSPINRYALNEVTGGRVANIATFSTASEVYFVRITSTFSYVTGLSVYLPVMFAMLLALISLNTRQHLKRGVKALYYAAAGATVVLSVMTGSRGAVLAVTIIAVIFYFFTSRRNTFRRLQQLAAVGVILYILLMTLFPQAYDAFYNRTFGSEDRMNEGWERIAGALNVPVDEASYAGLLGYGIGLTQNSVPALMKRLDIVDQGNPIPIGWESEPGRVMLELGLAGFVLYTLLRMVLLFTVFRICLTIRDPESKLIAFAAAAALTLPLIIGGAVVAHTQNVYQWFLIGVVLALLNAERLQQLAAKPPAPFSVRAFPLSQHSQLANLDQKQ